jgi:hypothetical protein
MTGALLAFAAALTASSAHAAGPDDVRQAIEVIEATYGAQVDAAELYRAALQGIAVELDRAVGRPGHAILTETEHSAVDAWLDGHRKGIAAEFAVVAGQGIVITDVYPGGQRLAQDWRSVIWSSRSTITHSPVSLPSSFWGSPEPSRAGRSSSTSGGPKACGGYPSPVVHGASIRPEAFSITTCPS